MIELQNCKECGGTILHIDNEDICSTCGLVINEEKIVNVKNYTYYNETKIQHTGHAENINFLDKGLPTSIPKTNYDAFGHILKDETKKQMFRLRRLQTTSGIRKDRTLNYGLNTINIICDKLTLPFSIRSRSSIIFREVVNKNLIKGRVISDIVAASIYYSCREGKIIRSLDDIADLIGSPKKSLARVYRFLLQNISQTKIIEPYNFTSYITKIGEQLHISGENQGEAIKLLLSIQQNSHYLGGKDPKGLASAALYLVCLGNGTVIGTVTQKDIAKVAGVTEVSVRNRYKGLKIELTKLGIKYE